MHERMMTEMELCDELANMNGEMNSVKQGCSCGNSLAGPSSGRTLEGGMDAQEDPHQRMCRRLVE